MSGHGLKIFNGATHKKIQKCEVCINNLPQGCNPVVQLSAFSKIIVIGQAPESRVHETGIPWNDKSGDTLRKWMDVDKSGKSPIFFQKKKEQFSN